MLYLCDFCLEFFVVFCECCCVLLVFFDFFVALCLLRLKCVVSVEYGVFCLFLYHFVHVVFVVVFLGLAVFVCRGVCFFAVDTPP